MANTSSIWPLPETVFSSSSLSFSVTMAVAEEGLPEDVCGMSETLEILYCCAGRSVLILKEILLNKLLLKCYNLVFAIFLINLCNR